MTKWQRRWQGFCDLPGIVRLGAYLSVVFLLAIIF